MQGGWGNAIDVAALVGTLFGVATSLGLGVIQISAGLDFLGVVPTTIVSQAVIIGIITGLLGEGAAASLAMFPILFLIVVIQLWYIRRVEGS